LFKEVLSGKLLKFFGGKRFKERMMTKLNLTASVTIHEGRDGRPVSQVTIRYGELIVAGGTLGGKYTPEQAKREFRQFHNNPKRFVQHAGYPLFAQALAAGLV
jgi:hypothetical protein